MSDRVVDFTQARVNLIADALDRMTDQMLATNQRLLEVYEEFGEFKSEILLANQILNAQRDANRALFQLGDMQEQQAGEAGES